MANSFPFSTFDSHQIITIHHYYHHFSFLSEGHPNNRGMEPCLVAEKHPTSTTN